MHVAQLACLPSISLPALVDVEDLLFKHVSYRFESI